MLFEWLKFHIFLGWKKFSSALLNFFFHEFFSSGRPGIAIGRPPGDLVNCDTCMSIFETKESLAVHIISKHLPVKPINRPQSISTCDLCKREFKTSFEVASHMKKCPYKMSNSPTKAVKEKSKVKRIFCDSCRWRGARSDLIRHWRARHTKIKTPNDSYKCDICEKHKSGHKSEIIRHHMKCYVIQVTTSFSPI